MEDVDEEIRLLRTDEFDTIFPTKWDLYESMDRSSVQMNQLHDALVDLPGFDEDQAEKAQKAFTLLFEIYQAAGAKFFAATEDED